MFAPILEISDFDYKSRVKSRFSNNGENINALSVCYSDGVSRLMLTREYKEPLNLFLEYVRETVYTECDGSIEEKERMIFVVRYLFYILKGV